LTEVRTLDSVSFHDGLRAWNEGFEGYSQAVTMSLSGWLAHIVHEGLEPELSLVAYDGDRPVGCVLSGMRDGEGGKVAYNGGTGVIPAYRGKGVGRLLIDAALGLYRSHGAAEATLEVITTNEPAIALYHRAGYEVTDRLSVLSMDGPAELADNTPDYVLEETDPPTLESINFYRRRAPWQCQWQSVPDGRVLRAVSPDGSLLGYALVRRRFQAGQPRPVVGVFQMGFEPGLVDSTHVARFLAKAAFRDAARCFAMNIPASDPVTLSVLQEVGLREQVAQFEMRRGLHDA
jgi:ribosomal protein S18 acetylase RimI-like enzyme